MPRAVRTHARTSARHLERSGAVRDARAARGWTATRACSRRTRACWCRPPLVASPLVDPNRCGWHVPLPLSIQCCVLAPSTADVLRAPAALYHPLGQSIDLRPRAARMDVRAD